MAKYLVTDRSFFQPFTYDELVRPLQQMTDVHNAQQDAYDQLSMETAQLERYINQTNDPRAWKIYEDYNKQLGKLQEELWNSGIGPRSRKYLSDAIIGYAGDVKRLQNAITNRQKRSEEFWTAKKNNPDLVTGRDPGNASLDKYLEDDLYGKDWYAYDSAKFEKSIFDEVKARAAGMLRGLTDKNGVVKNPALAGILTRIRTQGVTNEEVSAAGTVFDDIIDMSPEQRQAYYKHNGTSDAVQLLTETLLNKYDATGIRSADVDESERIKLINRGKAGLAGGIMAPNVRDFEDPYFKQQMEYAKMRYSAKLAAEKAKKDKTAAAIHIDKDSKTSAGENYARTRRRYRRRFGPESIIVTKSGQRVEGGAQASDIVYGWDIRREGYEKLGYDIGRKKDDLLYGEVTLNGETYETQYNPHANGGKGVVHYRKKGDDTAWHKTHTSASLLETHRRLEKQYNDNLAYYKKNEPELYKAAKVDPDEQYSLFKRDKIDFKTSLDDYDEIIFNRAENSPNNDVSRYTIASQGTDEVKLRDRVGGLIAESFALNKEGKEFKNISGRERRVQKGTTSGIHKISENGTITKAAVNPSDAFTVKDGTIDNIRSVKVSFDSVMDDYNSTSPGSGYLIVNTTKGTFTVDVDVLPDDYRNAFKAAQQSINANWESDAAIDSAIHTLCFDLRELLGYENITYAATGTSSSNPY